MAHFHIVTGLEIEYKLANIYKTHFCIYRRSDTFPVLLRLLCELVVFCPLGVVFPVHMLLLMLLILQLFCWQLKDVGLN